MSKVEKNSGVVSEYAIGWRGRGNLRDLVAELERQKETSFDFVADTRSLSVVVDDGRALLRSENAATREFISRDGCPVNESAINQLAQRVDPAIPVRFIKDLMSQRPQRAADLLTGLLHDTASTNLVRVLDNRVRAFLSDRYQPIDNWTLAFHAMNVARNVGGEIIEASLSDSSMRIKFATRQIFDAIATKRDDKSGGWYAGGLGDQKYLGRVAARTTGDLPGGPGTIHPLVTIANSETGHGAFDVRQGILVAVCFNLATVEQMVNKVHLGARLDPGIFSQETLRKEAEAIMAKAHDSIASAFDAERFKQIARKCRNAQETTIEPTRGVDLAIERALISEDQRDSLLAHFLGDSAASLYGPTAYAFAQGLTRFAQTIEDGDDAAEIEEFAGEIIKNPKLVAVS